MALYLAYFDKIGELSDLLKPVSTNRNANAAVALLLRRITADLEVFFVKRAENPQDPWSGQIALPGGKRSSTDQDLKQTVIRETSEETNINLHQGCRFLGTLEPITSIPKPDIKILPFVVLVDEDPVIRLNPELVSFYWIPLQKLVHSRTLTKLNSHDVPAYVLKGIIIWGLTYRILEKFMKILHHQR